MGVFLSRHDRQITDMLEVTERLPQQLSQSLIQAECEELMADNARS
jgi:hypothetical protein